MPSESSIKKAEVLLAQLANKQAFLDGLERVPEKDEPTLTVTVQRVTTVFVNTKDNEAYRNLKESLYQATKLEIMDLIKGIDELLNE